ncbi:receptor-like protein 32 [Zingiber officinale]|uniref:receptor-like protein 32 n=1 Tax=Zingiber officinale TaxID=94328 RepID=UPI001C4B8C09|nr:receptor-like protein 32 [Zingiber officinale]
MPLQWFYYSLMLCGLMSLAFSFKEAAVATPTRGCSEVERDALLGFKANVKDPSHRLASWSPQIDCCKWSGVVCKTTNNASLFGGQHVVELNLQNPNVDNEQTFHTALRGEILSPSLLNLTRLERLNLSWNDFEGTQIPQFIGSFLNLKYLELYWSNFTGGIPSQLGNLSSLRHLGLQSGWSAASIAPRLDWLSGLSSLRYLDLTYVNLSTVSQNWLSEVNMLPSLQELYLFGCNLNHIPSSFNSHLNLSTSLEILDLDANRFSSSSLPNWLWRLTNLSLLRIDASGLIPAGISNLTRLTQLDISGNISSPLPVEIWTLNHLIRLDLAFNEMLTGPIPSKISQQIGSNFIPSYNLILSNNHINGSIPSFICKWEQLNGLDLSYNKLSGEIPKCWQKANTNLDFIHLGNNKLTGEIPSSIGNLIGLASLHLDKNDLGGQLPLSLRNCTGLQVIDFTGNNFWGSIPMWIGQSLQQLTVLILRSNKFSGIIPSNLGELSNLQILDLANNKLSGSIPYSFGNFSAIKSTSREMEDTISIGGSITYIEYGESDSISVVTKGYEYVFSSILYLVKLIDLSNNSLTGVIPQDLSRLTALHHLNLSYNNLSGNIPSGYQLQTLQDASIYIGNAHLCGALINKSCSNDVGNNVTKEELQKMDADRTSASPGRLPAKTSGFLKQNRVKETKTNEAIIFTNGIVVPFQKPSQVHAATISKTDVLFPSCRPLRIPDARLDFVNRIGKLDNLRGFGFVTFTSSEEASTAISGMDGKDVHGRMVRVNYATVRTDGFCGGGGGYGGGGGAFGGVYGGYGGVALTE